MKEYTILNTQKRNAVSKPLFKWSLESDLAASRRGKHLEFDPQKQNGKGIQKILDACPHLSKEFTIAI